jgi:glycosyltransferase involved in cell wall biosynthesis
VGQEPYEAGLNHLKLSEMTTVSSDVLRERFEPKSHAIRTVLNRIDPKDWEGHRVDSERVGDDHLRVLYGGAASHLGDLDEIKAGIEGLVRRQPVPWRLICFGSLPAWLHSLSKECPGKVICLPWIPFQFYPQAISWGGFDLAIAPLAKTEQPPKKKKQPCKFNLGKSNIKWLEAGVLGIPLLCSRLGPYAEIPDGCAIRVENTPVSWADALRTLLKDKPLRESLRQEARQAVFDEWTIDKGKENLQILLEETMARPRIESLEDTRLPSDPPVDQPEAAPQADAERPEDA